MKRPDVVALVFGVVISAIAALSWWLSLGGEVNWSTLKIAAPLGLVVVGVLGLAMSRNRD